MKEKNRWLRFLVRWRLKSQTHYYLLIFLSVIVGFLSGIVAAIIKHSVRFTENFLDKAPENWLSYLHFLYPFIGIGLAVFFMVFILKQQVQHGIPSILFAISKNQAYIKPHNIYSSIITSALTVGFGGSVGLEGPTVATGGGIGSTLGAIFKINYREKAILLGAAASAAMAAIFKAPMAGIVFALEVIMIDLTTYSIIPILLASVTGSLTSFLLLGTNVIYPVNLTEYFIIKQTWYFILLGIITGLIAVYFTKVYIFIEKVFSKINNKFKRLLIGSLLLGLLIFLFPALYGEGYLTINSALKGDFNFILHNNIFSNIDENFTILIISIIILILLKAFATSITFGAGGIGGIFAPTLFIGANTGLVIGLLSNFFGYQISLNNSALVAMSGAISGVLLAPLTGIILISEITHGYELLFPLLVTSTISYITARIFIKNNIYTYQLAKRGELLTHNADKNILRLLKINDIIEKDFITVYPDQTLGDLVKAVSVSHRNLFPVIDYDGHFLGVISLDRIRKIMFKPELYDKIKVKDIMFIPPIVARINESAVSVAEKLQKQSIFNIVVVDQNNHYIGFISKANLFSKYRTLLSQFSSD